MAITVTDASGKTHKVSGIAAEIILWLVESSSLFAVKRLRGQLAFEFSNDDVKFSPRIFAHGASPPGPV